MSAALDRETLRVFRCLIGMMGLADARDWLQDVAPHLDDLIRLRLASTVSDLPLKMVPFSTDEWMSAAEHVERVLT